MTIGTQDSSFTSIDFPRRRAVTCGLFLAALLAAFVLYRPDTAAPFDIIDFSETLPLMTSEERVSDRTRALYDYYVGHGRSAPLLSFALALKWELFSWWTPGWQWTRFALMLGVVVLTFRLLRRLGGNVAGAAVGSALFLVSEATIPGWLRPSVNEPFGTLLLLCAALIGTRYQETANYRRSAVLIATLVAVAILAKEMHVATVALPLFVALCRLPSGTLAWPKRSPRNITLVGFTLGATVVTLLPSLWAMTQARPDGYARHFDPGALSFSTAIFALIPAILPFMPISNPMGWSVVVADFAWLALLLIGWRAGRGGDEDRTHRRLVLVCALGLPLLRVLAYLPWPLQFPYYSIPSLAGTALLVSYAVTSMWRAGRTLRILALVASATWIGYAAAAAGGATSRAFATRRLSDALVTELRATSSDLPNHRVAIAVPSLKEQSWTGLGPTLHRYAAATSRPLPLLQDILCDSARRVTDRAIVVALEWHCPGMGRPVRERREIARRFAWERVGWRLDTLRAGVFLAPGSLP